MRSRSDIDTELGHLQQRLLVLCAELPPDQVREAFAREAEPLTRDPPAELDAYIQERIHTMLVAAGVIEDESPTG
ncbi:hypothetical protein E5843_03165 [Luteimonas yindakuii]|uniref:hypothetical protein n=1 Tax=Luteimonas yindakuii TaxID=2565782 RepID=UPI0010A2F45B|nr:hypothetical protein [Luteimonas yindakuii]QCO67027.1 hypothetical protein E5843_03165 [Luteimonas yindakuii]